MIELSEEVLDSLRKTAQTVARSARVSLEMADASYLNQTKILAESLSVNLRPLMVNVQKSIEILSALGDAGLTPNLKGHRSFSRLKDYQRLLKMGYAVFWVPRVQIVNELLAASSEMERRGIIVDNKHMILEDCRKALEAIQKPTLRNHRLHLESALLSMEHGNERAAQSAANVCFDALFDHLVDESAMSRFSELTPAIGNTSKELRRKHMDLDARFLYAALQSQLMIVALRKFDRLKPNTVSVKYGRHSTAHTVSAKQFNEHNAIQAIMISTSILATTDKLGRSWMTRLTDML